MRFILEKITDLHGLYVHELRVRVSAEKQMVDVMERLIESVANPDLKAVLVRHLAVTRTHASQLESLLNHASDDREPIKCKTIGAFRDELEAALQDTSEPAVLDSSLVAIARRIQHYELASYDSVRQWARSLQMSGDEQILDQVIAEEQEVEEKLAEIASRPVALNKS